MSVSLRRLPRWLLPVALPAVLVVSAAGVMLGVVRGDDPSRTAGALAPASITAPPANGRGLPLPPPGPTIGGQYLFTPDDLRAAYDLAPLYTLGFTGKGQTVVVIVSFGSPTLQADVATFCQQYGLPAASVSVAAPLGTTTFNPANPDMLLWARETEEDVETIHAIAPDAAIAVLTSPVDETQGTTGFSEFLQLEQYGHLAELGRLRGDAR
jgi:hypothetical protein